MTLFDYAVLLVVGLSVLLSVLRGAVREVLALVSWVAAFWVAQHYATAAAAWLPQQIPGQPLRLLAAFVILLAAMLLLTGLAALALAQLVKASGLGFADRLLGALFGLLRGVFIAVVAVLLAGLTALPRSPAWRNAMFSAPLEAAVTGIKPWLPDDLAKRIKYE